MRRFLSRPKRATPRTIAKASALIWNCPSVSGIYPGRRKPWPSSKSIASASALDQTVAVKSCDLQVASGEILALLGPVRFGQDDTAQADCGIRTARRGTRSLSTTAPWSTLRPLSLGPGRRARRRHGLSRLCPVSSFDRGAKRPLRTAQRRKSARQSRVEELLRLTELFLCGDRYPHELSGGQQQRVALARAFAPRPGVVLLDEPFNGLDPDLRPQMRREVAGILRHLGTAAVLVTHDQEEALGMADQVAVIRNGELQQVGTPEDIYYSPTTPFVANFVGHADFIPGVVIGERDPYRDRRFSLPPDFPPDL